MSKKVTIIKLGGSVITEKGQPFIEQREIIQRLCKEIHEARQEKELNVIVGHGGGSYPHVPAAKYKVNEGYCGKESYKGIAMVQDAASQLNRIVVREFIEAGENAMGYQLSCTSVTENGRIKEMFTKPLKMLLDYGMLPVVYGDVGLDLKQKCCILSTEEIINFIAKDKTFLKDYEVDRILVCGRVDGVFTGNPEKDSSAKFIPVITPKNISEVGQYLAESSGIDVTGGMKHKVERMLELAELGVESEIINALRPGNVKRALLGEKGIGTVIRNE